MPLSHREQGPLSRRHLRAFVLATCLTATLGVACSGSSGGDGPSATGGTPPRTGGAATGGASSSATGGGATTSTGGQGATGGAPSGGAETGGRAAGGSAGHPAGEPTGGSSTGGVNTGGAAAGGASATGGRGGAGGASSPSEVSCPTTVLKAGNTNHTLSSGGRNRAYVLHVPSAYTGKTAVPLIVDFHGHGGTGTTQQNDSPYPRVVDAEGVLMVFPTAVGDWNIGPCCADDIDDIAFARALVTEVERLGCVDPKRVYATGFSMGGGMSHQMACRAADVFAAVAPAAFDLLQENLATCKPQRPITVITFRGTADNLAIYAGGLSNLVRPINFLGAIASMKKWGELDGCTGTPADLGNNCQGFMASQCSSGVESIVCSKTGGGHEQGNATLGWPVLKRHTLP